MWMGLSSGHARHESHFSKGSYMSKGRLMPWWESCHQLTSLLIACGVGVWDNAERRLELDHGEVGLLDVPL